MFSDKQFGLPGGLIAVAKAIMEAKQNDKVKDDADAKKMKGGKTKVDLNPETDDKSHDSDYMNKKSMKEGKEHTIPKTEKEKKLAALAHPKDKITHKDVLVGRGVVKEDDLDEKITPSELRAQLKAKAAANKPNDDLEVEEAAKKTSTPNAEMPKRKLDWEKIKAVRTARKVAKTARHGDTSHLPKGYSSTFHKEDVELTDEELERLEAIAQSLDEAKPTIVSAPIRGANQDQSGFGTKNSTADYTISDSKKMKKEEIEHLDELKRTTLASYVRKASHDVATKSAATGRYADRANKVKDELKKGDYSNYQQGEKDNATADKMFNKSWKRRKGIDTAVSKLAHTAKVNANEEVEQIDEVIKIGTKVKMHAPGKDYHDQVGHVGEIKHGLFKGAEKSYTVDYGDERKKSVMLGKANVKMHKEETKLDEAKRGRPKNNPEPGEDEDEHEHVIMQLRKVVSTHGALQVKHLDGKSTKMTPQLAQHALNKHNAMKTADEKQDYEQKLHKSHDSMKSALGQ